MGWIILGVVVLLVLYFIVTYNGLVSCRNKVKDQWSQIEVLLKRRADLIPNLVETVKGYATHEKETFDAVISARAKAMSANTKEDEMKASGELSEAYPELKANTNFVSLQNSLQETEDKIAYARQFYNDAVLNYKNKIEMFPSNIVAGMFNFKAEPFFEAEEAAKEVPKVQF